MNIKCDHEHLGFIIKKISHCNQGYIKDITPKTTAAGIKGWKRKRRLNMPSPMLRKLHTHKTNH
eukprot:10833626-Ditylum_brightwellii.AAC.1